MLKLQFEILLGLKLHEVWFDYPYHLMGFAPPTLHSHCTNYYSYVPPVLKFFGQKPKATTNIKISIKGNVKKEMRINELNVKEVNTLFFKLECTKMDSVIFGIEKTKLAEIYWCHQKPMVPEY